MGTIEKRLRRAAVQMALFALEWRVARRSGFTGPSDARLSARIDQLLARLDALS